MTGDDLRAAVAAGVLRSEEGHRELLRSIVEVAQVRGQTPVATLKEDFPQKDVGINHFGFPKDSRLQSSDGRLLIAVTQIDSSA